MAFGLLETSSLYTEKKKKSTEDRWAELRQVCPTPNTTGKLHRDGAPPHTAAHTPPPQPRALARRAGVPRDTRVPPALDPDSPSSPPHTGSV